MNSWQKSYQKEGYKGLEYGSGTTLRSIQDKYRYDYLNFLNSLTNVFPSNSDEARSVYEAKQKIQRAVRLIGRLLGSAGRKASKLEIEELNNLIPSITQSIAGIVTTTNTNIALSGYAARLDEQYGLDTQTLYNTQQLIENTFKSKINIKGGPSALNIAGSIAAPAIGAATGLVAGGIKGLMYSTIGASGSAVVGAGFGLAGGVARSVARLGRFGFDYLRNKKRGGLTDALALSGSYGGDYDYGGGDRGYTPVTSSSREVGRSYYGAITTGSLFEFFDKQAYKTKYLKELLDAIKGGGDGGGGGIGKFLSSGISGGGFLKSLMFILAGGGLSSLVAKYGPNLLFSNVDKEHEVPISKILEDLNDKSKDIIRNLSNPKNSSGLTNFDSWSKIKHVFKNLGIAQFIGGSGVDLSGGINTGIPGSSIFGKDNLTQELFNTYLSEYDSNLNDDDPERRSELYRTAFKTSKLLYKYKDFYTKKMVDAAFRNAEKDIYKDVRFDDTIDVPFDPSYKPFPNLTNQFTDIATRNMFNNIDKVLSDEQKITNQLLSNIQKSLEGRVEVISPPINSPAINGTDVLSYIGRGK